MENPFKNLFRPDGDENKKKREKSKYEFRKFEEAEDDDEFFDLDDLFSEFHGNKFNFQGFPPSILKQFQEIFEAMKEFEDDPENHQRQKVFEKKYNEFRKKSDEDLDGKIYADQLDTLLKRISPQLAPNHPKQQAAITKKFKQPDEQKIMDMIHGTYREEIVQVKPRKRQVQKVPVSSHHFGGLPPFDLPPSSGRSWGKTVISIRKSDGTYETRKMERTPDGQTRTTITKMDSDGSSSTQSFSGNAQKEIAQPSNQNYDERNFVKHDGYTIPLW